MNDKIVELRVGDHIFANLYGVKSDYRVAYFKSNVRTMTLNELESKGIYRIERDDTIIFEY